MATTSQRVILICLGLLGLSCGDDPATPPGTSGGQIPSSTTGANQAAGTASPSPAGATPQAGRAGGAAGSSAGAIAGAAQSGSSAPTAGSAGSTATAGAGSAAAGSSSAGASGASAVSAGAPAPSDPTSLPHVTTTDGPGPYAAVVKVKSTPPGGWLIYPKDIGKDGVKHPIFLFGPGGGTTPDTYEQMGMHWDRYGSYGFVIYVLPRSTGDGAAMKAGLDWVIEQNSDTTSALYQKLDTTKVCAAGHSQGSVTTFDFMPDDRVTTTIHISGGSFDGMGPSHLSKDTMFLCGPDGDADVAEPQCETDFANSKVPTFYTKIQGSSHLTSGRLGWPAVIAWLLWHLAGHEEWRKDFIEPDGQFQMGIYKSQIKNW